MDGAETGDWTQNKVILGFGGEQPVRPMGLKHRDMDRYGDHS